MVIEFADPGIDWTPLFWALGLLVLGIGLFLLPFGLRERHFHDWMPMPGAILATAGLVWSIACLAVLPTSEYQAVVRELKVAALEDEGFSDVTLNGSTQFIASQDGDYFRGILIDLYPESGHRYQVSEIVDR